MIQTAFTLTDLTSKKYYWIIRKSKGSFKVYDKIPKTKEVPEPVFTDWEGVQRKVALYILLGN